MKAFYAFTAFAIVVIVAAVMYFGFTNQNNMEAMRPQESLNIDVSPTPEQGNSNEEMGMEMQTPDISMPALDENRSSGTDATTSGDAMGTFGSATVETNESVRN